MTKEIFFDIQQLLPILKAYQAQGSAEITIEQKLLLKKTYKQVNPSVTIDVSCGSCVVHVLYMLSAFFEREYPLYQQSLANDEALPKVVISKVELPAKNEAVKKATVKKDTVKRVAKKLNTKGVKAAT